MTKSKITSNKTRKTRIFISAGEASSDNLGYNLIKSLLKLNPSAEIAIVGGNKMESLGYKSLFPQSDIAVMGYFEVISSIFKIRHRINQTADFLKDFKPDLYVAIDSRGFNFRVIKKIKDTLPNTKYLNYVSPTIWAYRYNRIFAIKELFHHQFLLYPFEKKYYDKVGIDSTFIGHTLGYTSTSKTKKYTDKNQYVGCIFPGSRVQEIKMHMPIFLEAISSFQSQTGYNISIYISTLPHLVELVNSYDFKNLQVEILQDEIQKSKILNNSDIFLTKSGTISLELMQYNTPIVVAHKISSITAFFVKRFIKVQYVSIGNLIAESEIIPELLQNNCTAHKICNRMIEMDDSNPNYDKYLKMLRNSSGLKPHDLAAKIILEKILK